MNLSEAAKTALINAVGGKPSGYVGGLLDLHNAKLTGPSGGLTRKGSIMRARLLAEAEDRAFGA